MTTPAAAPCPEWAALLTATHLDDLSPAQQAALDAHLATCPACTAVRADYLRLDGYIQRVPTSRPLPAFPPQLLAAGVATAARQGSARRAAYQPNARAQAPRLVPQPKGNTASMPSGRIRGVAALVSLAVIVALFVVVLRGFTAGQLTGPHSGSGPSTTPTTSGRWVSIAGLTDQQALPIIAPSNPQVVYELSYPQNAPSQMTIRRSTDDGATWHNIPLPSGRPQHIDFSSLAVSPINASTVFLTIDTYATNQANPSCSSPQANNGTINALVHLSGSYSCSTQYYSTDGGQHWSRIQLPAAAGAIGAPYLDQQLFTSNSTDGMHAQGQRLYSALGGSNVDGVVESDYSVRIVASDDGGKSWKLVDADVAASGQLICNFTAAPTGSTLFAIAQTGGSFCYSDPTITDYLWRSDDGGATWTEVGKLPTIASTMLVVSSRAGAQPLLYIEPETIGNNVLQSSTVSPGLEVSADDGKTWQEAPTQGLPAGAIASYGPLGVLSNGSVLKAFLGSDSSLTLSSWKAGDTAWQTLVQQVDPAVAYLLLLSGDGATTLWLVTQDTNSPNTSYSVQTYTLA